MAGSTPRSPAEVEVIKRGLKQVLPGGVRPAWLVNCPILMDLTTGWGKSGSEQSYEQALILERILIEALNRLGGGPYGIAASLLFGAHSLTRGRLLKDRRRYAAQELEVLPSTFRKTYEGAIIQDLTVEVWRVLRARG